MYVVQIHKTQPKTFGNSRICIHACLTWLRNYNPVRINQRFRALSVPRLDIENFMKLISQRPLTRYFYLLKTCVVITKFQ